jgi:hypothetical protein
MPIEIQLARPYIAFAVAILADYLISTGKIAPEQREMWVQGSIQIASFVLGGILSCIVVWHEFKALHNRTTKVVTETTEAPVLPAAPVATTDSPAPTPLSIRDVI